MMGFIVTLYLPLSLYDSSFPSLVSLPTGPFLPSDVPTLTSMLCTCTHTPHRKDICDLSFSHSTLSFFLLLFHLDYTFYFFHSVPLFSSRLFFLGFKYQYEHKA